MKITFQSFILILLVAFFNSCEKDDIIDRNYPRINTLEVNDIDGDGAVFNAEIIYNGSDPITEYGFIWDLHKPLLGSSERVSMKGNPTSHNFNAKIRSTLKLHESYNVRAYIKTKDFTVLGNIINFESQGSSGAEIHSFSPRAAFFNDTISIRGKYFSYVKSRNRVFFGNQRAKIVSASDTLLKVLAPVNPVSKQVGIRVIVARNTTISVKYFTYFIPKMLNFFPKEGAHGDIITIKGENLGDKMEVYEVKFGGWSAEIVSVNNNEIKVKVPDELFYNQVKIQVDTEWSHFFFDATFKLLTPESTSLWLEGISNAMSWNNRPSGDMAFDNKTYMFDGVI